MAGFQNVAPIATAMATTPQMATSRCCPITASTSGTSSTVPVMVSEPEIAMSSTANAAWIASAIARRTGDQFGAAWEPIGPAMLVRTRDAGGGQPWSRPPISPRRVAISVTARPTRASAEASMS